MNDFYQGLLSFFKTPSPLVIAAQELEDAHRQLLRSQSAAEYANRISAYHCDRIKRLSAYIVDSNKDAAQ
jgi:hypothetical protein